MGDADASASEDSNALILAACDDFLTVPRPPQRQVPFSSPFAAPVSNVKSAFLQLLTSHTFAPASLPLPLANRFPSTGCAATTSTGPLCASLIPHRYSPTRPRVEEVDRAVHRTRHQPGAGQLGKAEDGAGLGGGRGEREGGVRDATGAEVPAFEKAVVADTPGTVTVFAGGGAGEEEGGNAGGWGEDVFGAVTEWAVGAAW